MHSPNELRIGILGAGLGSRLKSESKAKPLAMIGEKSLLASMMDRFHELGVRRITCALRDELLSEEDRQSLPQGEGIRYLFVNTESSLHTLEALAQVLHREGSGPVLFTMADTILRKRDLASFLEFCRSLSASENAVLVTPFVDDEKPLWVKVKPDGSVERFGSEKADFVTSGMYFFQSEAMEMIEKVTKNGMHKMRNFLSHLADQGFEIKTFVVDKTIDVDHPSDLKKAADFLVSD